MFLLCEKILNGNEWLKREFSGTPQIICKLDMCPKDIENI